jgi:soluble lytic murein transglycosylase
MLASIVAEPRPGGNILTAFLAGSRNRTDRRMKQLGAAVALLVLCASFVALAPGPLAAKSQKAAATTAKSHPARSRSAKSPAAKSPAAKSTAAKALKAKPHAAKLARSKSAKSAAVPLPDRNPTRSAAAMPAASESAELTASIATEPLPDTGATVGATPADADAVSIPLPDRNPAHAAIVSPAPPPPDQTTVSEAAAPRLDYAAILRPLLDYELSASDAYNLQDAVHASFRGDDPRAHAAIAKIKDSAARKLAEWYEYKNGDIDASADAIEAFRRANADWPGQDELRERAEIALFLGDAAPDQVRAFFRELSPITGAGKAALASAFMKDGNEAAARELVVSAWRDYQLSAAVEKKILARFSAMLSAEDHQARIDKLLFPDSNASADAALRIAKLLPAADQKTITARIAVVKRGANAGKLLDALPASVTAGDVGLLYNRIQWLRRKDRDAEAWKMLLDAPSEPAQLIDPDGWWTERRLNCRIALNAGQPRIAYEIASKHGPISGDDYIEAEFLAGWIALRFLSEPKTAREHLLSLRAAAKGSKNLALAEYWLGRTALALGDNGSAIVHFHAAAKYPQYFYGQLGRQALDSKPAKLAVTPTPLPTAAEIQSFMANDAVRAIGIAYANGMDRVAPQFFLALARGLNSAGEVVLLAEFAKLTGNAQITLRLAKIAFNRDVPVGDYALPIGVLPQFKSLLADRVDPALVHALSRQESEFNAGAKSPVGASGLMQLMPGTAKAVAKAYKVKFQPAQLTNPTYNVQLGEAHLRDLIDSYSGSYFLALAAYNAGGGRVQEWMRAFGDPRDPRVDPIDWIERIPFTETRDYVKKIMETLQLYRSRLSGSDRALQLVQDLNRGRSAKLRMPPLAIQAKSD